MQEFEHVFLPNSSSKSTFAQNKSCRSSLPLQLLFWPNFKFLYEKLRSGWSNLGQNSFETSLFLFLFSLVHAHTATGDAPVAPRVGHRSKRRLASKLRRSPRRPRSGSFAPLLLPARARDEPSRAEPPSLAAPVTLRHPASILRAPTSLASPRTSFTHPRARLSRFPSRIEPATIGRH